MQPRIKLGLIVGAIGAVLNICVAAAVGVCGPAVSLVAGAIAGYFAAQQERPATKAEGARSGATAGAIAGGLIIVGQVIGGLGALFYMQASGAQLPFGNIPSASQGAPVQMIYYLSGAGTAICFGIVGTLLAAGAGAGTGYLGTAEQIAPPSSMGPTNS
jgi:hypothetical protein